MSNSLPYACLLLAIVASCQTAPEPPPRDTDGTDSEEPLDTLLTQESDCPDADGDGFTCDDCNDADAAIYPGAPETCDGEDSNCDGETPSGESLFADEPACAACAAAGYWPDVRDASDDQDLLTRIAQTASTNGICVYSQTIDFMFLELDKIDGQVEGVYTGFVADVDDERPDSNFMNTEHTWPRANGGGVAQRECDLHHLFPTKSEVNNTRGSLPFAEVVRAVDWESGGSKRGEDRDGVESFEPRPVHQGNVARAMMYMALRYDLSLTSRQRELFLAWHGDDPVDEAELSRTQKIQERQANANPFVACPELASRLVDQL